MVYTAEPSSAPSLFESAQAGNFQAIAAWLNQSLAPYGIVAAVSASRPGCVQVSLELPPLESAEEVAQWQDFLVRFVCHQIWTLNSALIEGVQVVGRMMGQSALLWQKTVRVVSPARRSARQQTQQLQVQVKQATKDRVQWQTMRSFLLSGSALFAFMVGCLWGYASSPTEQTNAVAVQQEVRHSTTSSDERPRSVKAALETIPVIRRLQSPDPKNPATTLMFGGDLSLVDYFADAVGGDPTATFSQMPELSQVDLAMVNLKNPFTKASNPIAGKSVHFKADPEMADVLKQGGIDIVSLANNHTMDYQEVGLVETLESLDQVGVKYVGAGRDVQDARRPEIFEIKGQRIAYLGYESQDFESAHAEKAGTNFAEQSRIAEDVKALRDDVDWIVVNFHWEGENSDRPAGWQRDLARFAIDQGADVVVGHHPQALQGAEIYKGRPIAYSLGNFIFGGNPEPDYDTAVMKVSLNDHQMKVEFLPVEVHNFQPKIASGEKATEILGHLQTLSSEFEQPMKMAMVLDTQANEVADSVPPPTNTASDSSGSASAPTSPESGKSEGEKSEGEKSESGKSEGEKSESGKSESEKSESEKPGSEKPESAASSEPAQPESTAEQAHSEAPPTTNPATHPPATDAINRGDSESAVPAPVPSTSPDAHANDAISVPVVTPEPSPIAAPSSDDRPKKAVEIISPILPTDAGSGFINAPNGTPINPNSGAVPAMPMADPMASPMDQFPTGYAKPQSDGSMVTPADQPPAQ